MVNSDVFLDITLKVLCTQVKYKQVMNDSCLCGTVKCRVVIAFKHTEHRKKLLFSHGEQ